MKNKGCLIVISGPSGAGKGTVLKRYLEKDENSCASVSVTTRAARKGETEGVEYFFSTKEKFEEMLSSGDILEHNFYNGNYYGTPKTKVMEKLAEGKNVILEIDVNGGRQIRELCPEALLVFISPPSLKELEERLRNRGTETEEAISNRLKIARDEMTASYGYDYVILNDEIELAAERLAAIVKAEKCKTKYMKEIIDEVVHYA